MKRKKLILKRLNSSEGLDELVSELRKELPFGAVLNVRIEVGYVRGNLTPMRLRIIQKRKGLGISQAELATQIGLSQSRLSKFESGTGDIGFIAFLETLKVLNLIFKSVEIEAKEAREMGIHLFFKEVRLRKNMSQTQLSEKTSVHGSMISWFEKGGRISVSSLERLMDALDIKLF